MKAFFSEFAERELNDAVDYLEMEFDGLGESFKEEVRRAVERIRNHPLAWSTERGDVRKCLLHRTRSHFRHSRRSPTSTTGLLDRPRV